jgi:hypothetical protein
MKSTGLAIGGQRGISRTIRVIGKEVDRMAPEETQKMLATSRNDIVYLQQPVWEPMEAIWTQEHGPIPPGNSMVGTSVLV